jgi:hypothetical protein
VDHHFTKRFDGFVGIAYSYVSGGLAIAIPHGPGVPYNTTTTLLRQSVVVSPSDCFREIQSRWDEKVDPRSRMALSYR